MLDIILTFSPLTQKDTRNILKKFYSNSRTTDHTFAHFFFTFTFFSNALNFSFCFGNDLAISTCVTSASLLELPRPSLSQFA